MTPAARASPRWRTSRPANVGNLIRAWEFHTGDLARRDPQATAPPSSRQRRCSSRTAWSCARAFNEVIALDPGTGAQKWRFDPKISPTQRPANRFDCRGVTYWMDREGRRRRHCRSRVFMGTNDMRVVALDVRTGAPCADFGVAGEVRIDVGMPLLWPGEMKITSAPVVARGSSWSARSIADNVRVAAPRGTVRAFDARTGRQRWTWDPLVHEGIDAGHANVWAPMSVDEERGLVFLPTSSPSPDFWGGKRPGNNEHSGLGGGAAGGDR